MTDKSDLYYVKQVQKGETECFVPLVGRYKAMVFTVINKIVPRRDEAEDLVQEVFIKVYQNIGKFKSDSEFSTWLYRIAYNTAISEFRKKRNNHLAFDDNFYNIADGDISDSIDQIGKQEQLRLLDKVLGEMPKDDALLITMFYVNNHTIKEIGEITDLSESNVKVKLHRIRKYMSVEINKLIEV